MALFGASFFESRVEIQLRVPADKKLTHLSCKVLQDCSRVDSSGSSNTSMAGCAVLQVTVDTSDGELIDDETRF
jgi:hypothetical protein